MRNAQPFSLEISQKATNYVEKALCDEALNQIELVLPETGVEEAEVKQSGASRGWSVRPCAAIGVFCCWLCNRRREKVETVSSVGRQFSREN